MSETITGILAFCARPSTAGAVELSVGEMQMPATPRAITSCAFFNWVAASLWLSSAWNP